MQYVYHDEKASINQVQEEVVHDSLGCAAESLITTVAHKDRGDTASQDLALGGFRLFDRDPKLGPLPLEARSGDMIR